MKKPEKKSKNFKFSFLSFVILSVIISVIFFFITDTKADANFSLPDKVTVQPESAKWWNNEYAYRREVIIDNNDINEISVNHAELVVNGKSNVDGSDLKLIVQSENAANEVSAEVFNPDSIKTSIKIKGALEAAKYKYFLYYGNKIVKTPTQQTKDEIDNVNTAILKDEETPQVLITNIKKWALKEKNSLFPIQITTSYKIGENTQVFLVDGQGKRKSVQIQNNLINIDLSQLDAGEQNFFIIIKDNQNILRSNTIKFLESAPVYVAWTINWEGVDPGKANIEDLGNTADDFKIALTQFFNPRIFINIKISDQRRNEMLSWVKTRLGNGDDLGMSMHMQFDLVEEAGVKAKYDGATWDGGLSGYDMPGTVYSHDQYLQMLNWGKDKYKSLGLPEPSNYRAGGWFLNIDNMRAIQDAGFKNDSSSIVPFQIGDSDLKQDWKITNTVQPYFPSQSNLNSDASPSFTVKEIPDNGGDSHWTTQENMYSNFTSNYNPGTISTEKKLIVYSTSVDWFSMDKDKIEQLFTAIGNYRNDIDKGPVKFTTIKDYNENSI